MKTWLIALALASIATVNCSAEERFPASAFAKLPEFKSMALSPNGRYIVALQARQETYHTVLIDLKKKSSRLLMASDPDQFLFDWCRFANNERVVCKIRHYLKLTANGNTPGLPMSYKDGRATFTRLLAVNIDASDQLQLINPARSTNSREQVKWNAVDQSTVISWLPGDKRHILVQVARDNRIFPSVFKLDIYNNQMSRVQRNREPILRWYANAKGKLVLAVGLHDAKPVAFALLDNWQSLDVGVNEGARSPVVASVTNDGRSAWLIANNGKNTRGLVRYDLMKQRVAETGYRNDNFDVMPNVGFNSRTGDPLFVSWYSDHLEYHWFNEQLGKTYDAVKRTLPGHPDHVELASHDDSLKHLLFYAEGNGSLPGYYLYNATNHSLTLLAHWHNNLGSIAKLQPVSYPSRDGVDIPAYVALPGNVKDGPWPTVILPHGGPAARSTDDFDYQAQMFVKRGYAVLKPNFRGSAGYGDRFMTAGYGQWGMRIQNDVMDGLDWMIKQGYTDPKHVCIVGSSFGGYVALVAAYKAADRFQCAVSFGGISDLDALVLRRRNYVFGREDDIKVQSGPAREANSPIQHANSINLPLLIVHGDDDRSVLPEQSTTFVDALKKAGKPVTFIEQPNGDHFLSRESQRKQFMESMDAFLARYLTH